MTILVVDDELGYRMLLRDLLTQQGHNLLMAGNGQEALEKIESVDVDFIISDVYMPVMDGFKFHNAIRSSPRWENIPFLFVSAYDDQYTLDAIKNPKIDGFVKKARPTSELIEWLKYLSLPEEARPKIRPGLRQNPPSPGGRR